jgi:hypothetical protein
MTEPTSLEDARTERIVRDICREYPAIAAGGAPVRACWNWMETNGLCDVEIAHFFVYEATAEIFRRADSPQEAERLMRDMFEAVLTDLRENGPESH